MLIHSKIERRPAAFLLTANGLCLLSPCPQACSRLVPTEFLVNVDNPDEGQIWADLSYSTEGLVVPVMSYNVHELRAYNRLASLARGRILVLLQVRARHLPYSRLCRSYTPSAHWAAYRYPFLRMTPAL